MCKRIGSLLLLTVCFSCFTSAQSLVLTWEDDATIQVERNPDGTIPVVQPEEKLSGGLAAKFSSRDETFGGPMSSWIATDIRLQSKSVSVAWNAQACGGHLLSTDPSNGVGVVAFIATHYPVDKQLFTRIIIDISSPGLTCSAYDVVNVTLNGVSYTGTVQFDGPFSGTTIDAPGEIPNATASVEFGPPTSNGIPGGAAIIRGTLRAEISDYNARVVKLRQGIEPLPASFNGSWSDGSPPWEADAYNGFSSDNPIYKWGCYLTAFSMALNSEGIHFVPKSYCGPPLSDPAACPVPTLVPNDPGNLNRFISKPSMQYGYDSNGNLDIANTVYALSQSSALNKPNLQFHADKAYVCSSSSSCTAAENFLTSALQQGHPVIVGVEDPPVPGCNHFPCHFVLVWGKRNGEWLIADPWPTIPSATVQAPRLKLSDWGSHYVTVGYLSDPTSTAGLEVTTPSDVELLLTGPTGKRTGYDPGTRTVVQEGGAYLVESIMDAAESGTGTKPSRFILVQEPTDGQYTLTVTGLRSGTYSVNVHAYSQDGYIQPVVTLTGVAGPVPGSGFSIALSTSPGASSTAVRSATIGGTLGDISNSLSAGLITQQGVAQSLSDKIRDAAIYDASGACTDYSGVLHAFQLEVEAQTGKAIDPAAAQVLLEDSVYLSTHCGS